MDRSAFAAWAVCLAPCALAFGCGQGTGANQAPAALPKLEASAPLPRRLAARQTVRPASLDRGPQNSLGKLEAAPTPSDEYGLETFDFGAEASVPPTPSDSIAPIDTPDAACDADQEAPQGGAMPAVEPTNDEPAPGAKPALEASEPTSDDVEPAPLQPALPVATEPATSAAAEPVSQSATTAETAPSADSETAALEAASLPWANSEAAGAQMRQVTERADLRVRRGFQLAERGAIYSARREFLAALQLLAQANDVAHATQFFSQALNAGLVALKEAEDFSRQNANGTPVSVPRLVAGHKTPLLKGNAENLSPLAAAQRYYTYAQEQLSAAAAADPAGSLALYALGRAALGPSNQHAASLQSTAQAMALYQAALMADSKNFRAANELGVLMAGQGNLPQARDLFLQSAAASPQAATWYNLASVHLRMKEPQLAAQAKAQGDTLARAGRVGSNPLVHVVDTQTFAQTRPASDSVPPQAPAAAPAVPQPAKPGDKPAATTAKKSFTDWLPWTTRR